MSEILHKFCVELIYPHQWGIRPWHVASHHMWTQVGLGARSSHLFPPGLALSRMGCSACASFRLELSPVKPPCPFPCVIVTDMSHNCGGHYWFGQVFSWGWAPERNTPGSNVLLLSGRAKTQKDETVSRGVKEAESRIGTDNSDTDVLPAHLRSWLYL